MGWTQVQAAAYFDCSERQYQRYEAGDATIPVMLEHGARLAVLTKKP